MQKPHLTQLAHELIREHFIKLNRVPNNVVDATCGNGHDTVFLAKLAKHVFAFDIQAEAIKKTKERLEQLQLTQKVSLHQICHSEMSRVINSPIDCIVFNLGYLPKGDKSITTLQDTSLNALDASLDLLSENGLLSILCYPGHPEGKIETRNIQNWLSQLENDYQIHQHLANYPNDKSPILYQLINNKSI